MQKQYWVIGADYSDMQFKDVVDGSTQVHGPFGDYSRAARVWREHANMTRYQATTRFTIVVNAGE